MGVWQAPVTLAWPPWGRDNDLHLHLQFDRLLRRRGLYVSRGHNQRNEAVRSATRLRALNQKQDKNRLVWGLLPTSTLALQVGAGQEESESCGPQLVRLEMLSSWMISPRLPHMASALGPEAPR